MKHPELDQMADLSVRLEQINKAISMLAKSGSLYIYNMSQTGYTEITDKITKSELSTILERRKDSISSTLRKLQKKLDNREIL